MDPLEVGERVLHGIRRSDLFIMSHPEFRAGLIARNEALVRALPQEPLNTRRQEVVRMSGRYSTAPSTMRSGPARRPKSGRRAERRGAR